MFNKYSLILITITLFLTNLVSALEWHIITVDDVAADYPPSKLAIDSNGYPHISYTDRYRTAQLKYAFFDGSDWQITEVDSVNGVGGLSLALDSYDHPHIAFVDTYNYDLNYVFFDGTEWNLETVDSSEYRTSSIALAIDNENKPCIAYYQTTEDPPSRKFQYARRDDSGWNIETVDDDYALGLSIAVDSSNRPHLSYYGYNHLLKYAYFDGNYWVIGDVDYASSTRPTSLSLDTSQNPHIAYLEETYGDNNLKYAYWDGVVWNILDVDEEITSVITSLALDSSNNAHIAYSEWTQGPIRYAYYDGEHWDIEVVDSEPWTYFPSIAIGLYNNPQISYAFYHELKYAWYGNEYIGVDLLFFDARPVGKTLALSWGIENNRQNIDGFNLYRRSTAGTWFTASGWERINTDLITGENPYSYIDGGLENGITYEYKLEVIVGESAETLGITTGTAGNGIPKTSVLHQSRPNPGRGPVNIAFELSEDASVTLSVYDLTGRKVVELVNNDLPAGSHEVEVPRLTPGVYEYRLDAGNFNAAKKMVVLE